MEARQRVELTGTNWPRAYYRSSLSPVLLMGVIDTKCGFQSVSPQATTAYSFYSRGHSERDTPVPIPNTEVKALSGGSTWLVTARKISTLRG